VSRHAATAPRAAGTAATNGSLPQRQGWCRGYRFRRRCRSIRISPASGLSERSCDRGGFDLQMRPNKRLHSPPFRHSFPCVTTAPVPRMPMICCFTRPFRVRIPVPNRGEKRGASHPAPAGFLSHWFVRIADSRAPKVVAARPDRACVPLKNGAAVRRPKGGC
jgi:hypothetical protein